MGIEKVAMNARYSGMREMWARPSGGDRKVKPSVKCQVSKHRRMAGGRQTKMSKAGLAVAVVLQKYQRTTYIHK